MGVMRLREYVTTPVADTGRATRGVVRRGYFFTENA
jgi:hypothetical protein